MAKSTAEALIQDERTVLHILERHAKESVDQIAKHCGFSRQKVWRIIKRLEKDKVIWGYTTLTDEKIRNLKHFVLIVKRTILPLDDAKRREVYAEQLDMYFPNVNVENIYFTHGSYDMVITFYAPDLITAKKFLSVVSEKNRRYIQDFDLLETLFPVRKQGLKNPQIEQLAELI